MLKRSDNIPTVTPWYADAKVFEGSFEIALGYDAPDGFEGEGKGRAVITDVDVRRGLEAMARDHPDRFADIMADRGDAITADKFVQCALFGKAIYG